MKLILHRSVIKKILWLLGIIISFIWLLILSIFISSDIQVLLPEELQKLKEGKSFWKWSTSNGSFDVHFVEKGQGSKHVLLLHGFRAHTFTWRHIIDPLAEEGYHVWAIDLIGFGLSDKPDHVPYNMDFFCHQILAFMDAHEIKAAHFIGNSMGGGLSLILAIDQPERVHSLSLLNPLAYQLELPLYLSIARNVSQIWAPFLGPRMVRYCLKQIMFDPNLITEEQVSAYSLPYRLKNGIVTSLLTLQQFDNQYLIKMEKQYGNLKLPLLVIWGECDKLIPINHYENFIRDFPAAKHLLIQNCGHIPQEEAPTKVVSSLLSFLGELNQL